MRTATGTSYRKALKFEAASCRAVYQTPLWGAHSSLPQGRAVWFWLNWTKRRKVVQLVIVSAGTASELSLAFVKANVYYSYKPFIQSLA